MTLKETALLYESLMKHPGWIMLEAQLKENINARQKAAFLVKPGPDAGYEIASVQGYVKALEQVIQIPRNSVDAGQQMEEAHQTVYGQSVKFT